MKKPEKNIIPLKTYTPEEIKKWLLGDGMVTGDLEAALYKLAGGLFSKYRHGTPKEKRKVEKEANEAMSAVFYGLETETQIALMGSFSERYAGGVKQICRQFIRDFDCKNVAEKVLAETTAVAFGRYMDASRRFNNCLNANEHISPNLTAYLSMLSKERDRAHRQYLSTIMTLKQLKSPTIEMNIKTNTAFVSQNQQINVPQAPKENNEAK